MGDKLVIVDIQFLYGRLWQIDIKNETTSQMMRLFSDEMEMERKMDCAKKRAKAREMMES